MGLAIFVHNLGYLASAFLSLVLAVVIFVRGQSKLPNILFALTSFTFIGYIYFYIKGVNAATVELSQFYLSFSLILIVTVCLNAHLAFTMFKQTRQEKRALQVMYIVGAVILIFLTSDTSRFLDPSIPYQYLPNFFNPGPYYWLFTTYFFIVSIYFFVRIVLLYKKSDPATKNRIKYFLLAFGWAYGIGTIIFADIFGVLNLGMLYTSCIGLYAIPLAYGIFKYDVLDIHVAAKNALLYAFYSLFVGASIIFVNIFNNYLTARYANFPIWALPFASGVVVVFVSWLVWRQIREADILKYEFINNISHKFRTPLTHIRWLAEDLRETSTEADRAKSVEQIQYASMRLFELTNIVIDASENRDGLYLYHFVNVNVEEIVRELELTHRDQSEHKKLKVHIDIGPDVPRVKADKTRLQFALQILFENALIYTPENGQIDIKIRQIGGEVIISIKDNGIGIPSEDLPHVFSKFYRSQNARHTDTEGMGIGLFMAKNIIEKHHGRIWAESYGENKGAIFSIALPID